MCRFEEHFFLGQTFHPLSIKFAATTYQSQRVNPGVHAMPGLNFVPPLQLPHISKTKMPAYGENYMIEQLDS